MNDYKRHDGLPEGEWFTPVHRPQRPEEWFEDPVLKAPTPAEVLLEDEGEHPDYWVRIVCPQCSSPVPVVQSVPNGSALVTTCPNCNESVTLYNPPVQVFKTSAFEAVWRHLSNDPVDGGDPNGSQ